MAIQSIYRRAVGIRQAAALVNLEHPEDWDDLDDTDWKDMLYQSKELLSLANELRNRIVDKYIYHKEGE